MLRRHLHLVDLTLPRLPAGLAGLRIAHVTDLHVRRRWNGRAGLRPRHRRLASLLGALKLDLLLLTGDFMDHLGDEAATQDVLHAICDAARPRCGIFGVFGNHDRPHFSDACESLPVRWLRNDWTRVDGLDNLLLGGLHMDRQRPPDAARLALALHAMGYSDEERPLRIVLSHAHMALPMLADLGVDVVISGHTHGGQIRPLPGRVIYNSTDWPLRLTSGLMRHQNTLCATSRGLGEAGLPLRIFCPPQLPLFTLRPGPLPGRHTYGVDSLQAW
jgi:uncharacterized protein